MAKRRVSGTPKPLGFTADVDGAAIGLPTPQGEFIIEVPIQHLPDLMHLSAQLLQASAKQYGRPADPPVLPVWKWQAGAGSAVIHLRFQIEGGGAYAFSFPKKLAADLHSGLGEALGYRTERTHRPN
ncbi:hypothetical protein GCM10009081_33610 [Brevundimonas nasdae]|uniref:hypothetical protein n=1 Tax=Brevundimonas nasdae TaxID=172043 RepID=UPI0031D3651C